MFPCVNLTDIFDLLADRPFCQLLASASPEGFAGHIMILVEMVCVLVILAGMG